MANKTSETLHRLRWALIGRLYRLPSKLLNPLDQALKKSRCQASSDVVIHHSARISNNRERASIRIGSGSHILGMLETLPHGGRIQIGAHCFVGEHSYLWSAASIEIGNRVLISHGVNVHDHIAHSLSAARRHAHYVETVTRGAPAVLEDVPASQVVIEDDVWIGFNATVLRGVRIGRGAVVGANAVVTKDVEPFTVVVGNPARAVGTSAP